MSQGRSSQRVQEVQAHTSRMLARILGRALSTVLYSVQCVLLYCTAHCTVLYCTVLCTVQNCLDENEKNESK